MPEPRPLVAIERLSASVSEICLSGEASTCCSIAASFCISDFSFSSFSLRCVFFSSTVSDGSCRSIRGIKLREITGDALLQLRATFLHLGRSKVLVTIVHRFELRPVDGNATLR